RWLGLGKVGHQRAGGPDQQSIALDESETFERGHAKALPQLLVSVAGIEDPVAALGDDDALRAGEGEQLPEARLQDLDGLELAQDIGKLGPRDRLDRKFSR